MAFGSELCGPTRACAGIRGASGPSAAVATSFVSGEFEARLDALWQAWEGIGDIEAGLLQFSRVQEFLQALGVPNHAILAAMRPLANQGRTEGLTQEQACSLCSNLEPTGPSPSSPDTIPSNSSSVAKAPLKKVLSKNRAYLGTGHLVYDDTVLAYIRKLEEHRKKCEADGRYPEAKAAARRLADLKTAQVEQLRQQLVDVQQVELAEVQGVYKDETSKFLNVWQARIEEYVDGFTRSLDEQKLAHRDQLQRFALGLSARPFKPTREYLESKRTEENLVKVRDYSRAAQVQLANEQLLQAHMEQVAAAGEAELRIKIAKMEAKLALEAEVLMSRGKRGRNELDTRRASETERRMYRFRNVLSELESMHRLEVVSLENFLDGQVLAGKAVPLKDGFRRKREQLLSTMF